ncbi:MAG: hypothetical protein ABIT05_14195 [Chitinophagaceae bacterium]
MKSFLLVIISAVTVQALYSCGSKAAAVEESGDADRRMMMLPDSTYSVSTFINDADDPVSLLGIDFTIGEDLPPFGDLQITASSSNTHVVPDSNLVLSGNGVTRNLKITAVAAGYSMITVTVTDGPRRHSYMLNYAASQATTATGKRWHAGIADASAAIVIDNNYMLVANDETNSLYLYNRNHSGLPVKSFDYNLGNALALTDSFAGKWKEVDVEAGVRGIRDPSVIYWIGSMSNNGAFFIKPNRNRIFAVRVSGKGAAASFSNAGYCQLRQQLVVWGNNHGYNFDSSAAAGKNAKQADGFNIEGMVFGPDDQTLYIGFRAPLVPATIRTKAVIAPVMNFEKWFNNGSQAGDPLIGDPIELDLGGRGIRDIIRMPNGSYVIIAGSCGAELVPAVYTWTGQATNAPVMVNSFALAGLNVEGVIPVYEGGQLSLDKLQLLTDNGNDIFYGDSITAKNLSADNFKKFSSVISESPKQQVPSVKQ